MKVAKILLCLAVSVFILSGCKKDPVAKAEEIITKATEQVEKCKTNQELITLTEETSKKLDELGIKNDELTTEQQEKLADALNKYMQACMRTGLFGVEASPESQVAPKEDSAKTETETQENAEN